MKTLESPYFSLCCCYWMVLTHQPAFLSLVHTFFLSFSSSFFMSFLTTLSPLSPLSPLYLFLHPPSFDPSSFFFLLHCFLFFLLPNPTQIDIGQKHIIGFSYINNYINAFMFNMTSFEFGFSNWILILLDTSITIILCLSNDLIQYKVYIFHFHI